MTDTGAVREKMAQALCNAYGYEMETAISIIDKWLYHQKARQEILEITALPFGDIREIKDDCPKKPKLNVFNNKLKKRPSTPNVRKWTLTATGKPLYR